MPSPSCAPPRAKTRFIYQFFTALRRPILLVNLDPASASPPYPHSLSIASLITLHDAMDAHGLGPNGAMLYCLEYLEANIEWLEEELESAMRRLEEEGDAVEGKDQDELDDVGGGKRQRRKWKRDEVYVVFDTPGQVELSTNHGSLKRIIEALQKRMGVRVRPSSLSSLFRD